MLLLVFQQQLFASEKDKISGFLDQTFIDQVPSSKRIWLNKDKQKEIRTKFNPNSPKISYRYWEDESKSVWVLNEIGKERDITTGIVIKNGMVEKVQVLVYRESRGGQVQNDRFTNQYKNKTDANNFIKEIDSISGATLSVNALNKQVKMALWLNQNK